MTDPNTGLPGLQGDLAAASRQAHPISDQAAAGRLRIDQSHGKDTQ